MHCSFVGGYDCLRNSLVGVENPFAGVVSIVFKEFLRLRKRYMDANTGGATYDMQILAGKGQIADFHQSLLCRYS